jgi:hypothetical protein
MLTRIAGIVFIFVATSFAWIVLGTTVTVRTQTQDGAIKEDVGQLWGTPQRQTAPTVRYVPPPPKPHTAVPTTIVAPIPTTIGTAPSVATTTAPADPNAVEVPLEASTVDVALDLEHRQKGLLWYSTYRVRFDGEYVVANHSDETREYQVAFSFPTAGAIYDNFRFAVGGKDIDDLRVNGQTIVGHVKLAPGGTERVSIAYGSQGLDSWWYDFGSNVTQVKNLRLTMRTNFDEINFPQNAISPVSKTKTDAGWELRWEYANLLSGVQIGMEMPQRLNPGPWVSQITFFAPVSLFFFFFLLFMISTIQRVPIHPMNYFFIGTGFFSFHLLLAYLVDHLPIHISFAICSVVSLFLVITYMRLVVGYRFAIFQVGISQFVYLVLFGYTFFFEKYTGLAVTIMSLVTLFVVMQATGRVDWSKLGQLGPPPSGVTPPSGATPPASATPSVSVTP